jgi:hypothetical protein
MGGMVDDRPAETDHVQHTAARNEQRLKCLPKLKVHRLVKILLAPAKLQILGVGEITTFWQDAFGDLRLIEHDTGMPTIDKQIGCKGRLTFYNGFRCLRDLRGTRSVRDDRNEEQGFCLKGTPYVH